MELVVGLYCVSIYGGYVCTGYAVGMGGGQMNKITISKEFGRLDIIIKRGEKYYRAEVELPCKVIVEEGRTRKMWMFGAEEKKKPRL